MKKSRKIRLSIAGGLVLVGLILFLIGFQSGGNKPVYWTSSGLKVGTEKVTSIEKTVDPYTNLVLNMDLGKINIIYGDTFKISGKIPKDTLKLNHDGTTLQIQSKSNHQVGLMNFGFNPLPKESELTITIPKDTPLEVINLSNDAGKTLIKDMVAKELIVDVDAGKVEIVNSTFQKTTTYLDAGEINLDDSNLGNTLIETSAGLVKSKNTTFNGLNLNIDFGTIDLNGIFLGNTVIEQDAGDITLTSSQSEKEFNFDLAKEAGSIKLNNENVGTTKINNLGATNGITANLDFGDLTLLFNQPK